ncbi:carbohydrate ABC transporter permease [Deinococcus peraridilitoris]|uniref:Permease component of ABC-type sugar transporter n=1 Tax=Deinococcus peraridilitoris (strain DSM 19664 / LMG 22246 / CIP 109416 / KR-200) TaxID=937777 RepID=L0A0H7_DEIPD|nr:sugar ABC transporter permease [Deinococcus peraridilitoris]AFZ67398.1 permease component of ABC-type sugar transporter [Deinococcus peraridilitoris DSM 19664]
MRDTISTTASTEASSPRVARLRKSSDLTAALMLAPFLIAFVLFFIFPMMRAVQLSFTNSSLTQTGPYVGFANYARLIGDADFWASLRNTGAFALYTTIPTAITGLLMALGVNRLFRAKNFALALFFLPFVLPVSVVTLLWQWILNGNFGIVNALTGLNILWFNQANTAMVTVAVVTVWWTVGFKMLLFLAGLQNIPKETYEAAALDGAQGFQVFRYITWPLLWPITTLVLILQLIASLKIFAQVYILTGGGPFNSTRVVLQYMYETAFQNLSAGYASTIAVAFFLIVLTVSLLQAAFLSRKS